jgi:hypothetical protein
VTEPEVAVVLREVPQFAGRYVALAGQADGDPGAAAVFEELADFAGELLRVLGGAQPCLARLLGAVEEVASTSADAEELVGGAFLDNLGPDELRLLERSMGPATRAIRDGLELPPAALADDRGRLGT